MLRCTLSALSILVSISFSFAQDAATATPVFPKGVFGLKAGVNLSQFSASFNSETRGKVGPAFGTYIRKQAAKNFFLRPELYYSNQGQRDNYVMPSGGGPAIGRTTTNLHYVNIPFLFEVGKKVTFQFGVQAGLLVVGKEKGTYQSAKVDENLKRYLTAADFAVVAGIGVYPGESFNCGVRLNYGVTDLSKGDNNPDTEPTTVSNRVFHFYVAYSLKNK